MHKSQRDLKIGLKSKTIMNTEFNLVIFHPQISD